VELFYNLVASRPFASDAGHTSALFVKRLFDQIVRPEEKVSAKRQPDAARGL